MITSSKYDEFFRTLDDETKASLVLASVLQKNNKEHGGKEIYNKLKEAAEENGIFLKPEEIPAMAEDLFQEQTLKKALEGFSKKK